MKKPKTNENYIVSVPAGSNGSDNPDTIESMIRAARHAGLELSSSSHERRANALMTMAAELERSTAEILANNSKDLSRAKVLLDSGKLTQAGVERLALNEGKILDIANGIRQVAGLPDPLGRQLLARELDEDLTLYQITYPIGLIAVIFESRPDVLPQILSLCLKSGNAAILKGGREAENTNNSIFRSIVRALQTSGINPAAYVLSHRREIVQTIMQADNLIDLIIPRGSNALVRSIMENTRIPVLGHAAGICHIVVDASANEDKALNICLDAKTNYPAACNAVETILIHENIASRFVPKLLQALSSAHVESRCDSTIEKFADISTFAKAKRATDQDFGVEYGDMIVSLKVIESLDAGISHINEHGSNHTDAIVTESPESAQKFCNEVCSAGVFHNASTRFADGFRYGFGAEVGISNGKLHPRGPVGLDGLVTYKYKLVGNGHVVNNYMGQNARAFTHRDILNNKDTK